MTFQRVPQLLVFLQHTKEIKGRTQIKQPKAWPNRSMIIKDLRNLLTQFLPEDSQQMALVHPLQFTRKLGSLLNIFYIIYKQLNVHSVWTRIK